MTAEAYAVVKHCGSLALDSTGLRMILVCREISLLKKTAALLKDLYDASISIDMASQSIFRNRRLWRGSIGPAVVVREILAAMDYKDLVRDAARLSPRLYRKRCCLASFIRGTFLARGYLADPGRNYLLEFTFSDPGMAEEASRVLQRAGLKCGLHDRRRQAHVVYCKDGDSIARFLGLTGAVKALLDFENIRVMKSMKGEANRLTNFETANIERLSAGAERHVKAIRRLVERGSMTELPDELRQVAELRLHHSYLSLREIGERCRPPVTKATVAYRLRRLLLLAGPDGKK